MVVINLMDGKTRGVLGEMWREACDKGKSLSFKIVSGSMRPLINVGDGVKVSRIELSRVRIGDIVAFREGRNVVVHRVIGKNRSDQQLSFRHRGDSGALSGIILAQDLIGRVTVIEKEGHEIRLDSPRYIISNRLLGWRLRFVDTLGRRRSGLPAIFLRQVLRPPWRLFRSLLLRRL